MNSFKRSLFFRGFQSADEQFHLIARFAENATRGKEVLNRENFRRRHQRRLRAILDGNDRCLQRDDGFPAANISLQKPVHRRRLFEVRNDFRKYPFLCLCWLEWQNAFQRLADAVLAHAESDGIFLPRGTAIQAQAELVLKKLLKNQPLLRWRAKRIQRVERLRRLREMRADDRFPARGKLE